MICKIRNIGHVNTLHTLERIEQIVNVISIHNRLTVINKMVVVHEKNDKTIFDNLAKNQNVKKKKTELKYIIKTIFSVLIMSLPIIYQK
jgi:hypothetical protein